MAKERDPEQAQFDESPKGLATRWKTEIEAAKKWAKKEWWEAADEANSWYLDKPGARTAEGRERHGHWNMYSVGIQLQKALLFGKTPRSEVTRTFNDAGDQLGRVASEMSQRKIDGDFEDEEADYINSTFDYLITGGGFGKIRYEPSIVQKPGRSAIFDGRGKKLANEIQPYEQKGEERVCFEHWYWRDVLWSPCRKPQERRWMDFASYMSKRDLIREFGEKGAKVAIKKSKSDVMTQRDANEANIWGRAVVHEIWDKDDRKVYWYADGHPEILRVSEDLYGLPNFWPCPEPMFDNTTTSAWVPRPDWAMHQDQYKELELVSARIFHLIEAVKANGAYNGTFTKDLQKVLTAKPGTLVPLKDVTRIAEKGGLDKLIYWLPLDQIVQALHELRDYRGELMSAIYMFTGLADVMHGQAADSGVAVTATERRIQAKFASIRLQHKQDRIAKFVTEAAQIKHFIMAKKFSPQTWIKCTNMAATPDADSALEAALFLKANADSYRISVKSEAISFQNFAEMKQERTEFMTGLATFISSVAPAVQMIPGSVPLLLDMIKWVVTAYRGASEIEGELDKAISAAEQMAKQQATQPQAPPPPDPKLLAEQVKAQATAQKVAAETQSEIVRMKIETEEKAKQEWTQATANTAETAAKHRITHGNGGVMPIQGGTP